MKCRKISKKRLNAAINGIQSDIHKMRMEICKPYIKHRHENNPELMKECENKLNKGLQKLLENPNYDFLVVKNNFGYFEVYMNKDGEWSIKLLPPEGENEN